MKAIWRDTVIAESDDTVVVEGNHYFPPTSVSPGFALAASSTHTVRDWKGTANYYGVVVDGEINADAAWYCPEPKPAASQIEGRLAFWKGVRVVD